MIRTISYLGLGTMGSGMASNLLKAGYNLTVWNRSAEKCGPFGKKGARIADTPSDAVRDAELVMYCLSNGQAVEEVVFGPKGILSGIREGQIAIDMSTVLPATSVREQQAFAKRGVDFLDVPVFGSKQESADAKLWIMAAGNKAIFEKVKPVLEHLGQTIHYFGKNGNAVAMKLVGNLIVALELEALSEGLVLAQKAGLDLSTVMEVVKVADFRSPLLVSNGQNILKRNFSPSFALKLMLKDAGLIEKFADSLESPIPALRIVEKNLESAVALGFGEENASAIIRALEKEAGVEVKAQRVGRSKETQQNE
ncbi:MAG TPA: NAD(P)-dependent oxidoreductase [Candidatus Dormibacteraeota bacterium]|jgi:3-hydroxyisobutyrate dehydrogenase-like beta-hydroxyacid dehydrogenase|nr:NAD(P)-dependent oxidoreductase [Candidatus Dormibacteraeota bacterium]